MAAAARLGESTAIRVIHIGEALSPELAQRANETMAACSHYHWLGGLSRETTRRWIARAHALVHMSRLEGGAQAIIEAVRSGVPVLASRIGGNVGLLGEDYAGYFEVGNSQALARSIERIAAEPGFAALLASQCALREPGFRPETEQRLVRQLLADLLGPQGAARKRP
jgi:glycosyltransferase involved in cell wall biosynthesis